MGLEVFDNYECDGQISIFDYLKGKDMIFQDLYNGDEKQGKIYCGSCKHFKAELRKQYGQILGHCPYSKMKKHKACMPRCKKHYEYSNIQGIQLADNFVDECEWGTMHGLDEAGKEKIRRSLERKERIRRIGLD